MVADRLVYPRNGSVFLVVEVQKWRVPLAIYLDQAEHEEHADALAI
jgi:hypothetical protein